MNQGGVWSVTRGASSGLDASDSDAASSYGICAEFEGGDYRIYRCFFRFDLSAIPAAAEIVSCHFYMSTYVNPPDGSAPFDNEAMCQRGTQGLSLDMDNFNSFAGGIFGRGVWHEYKPLYPAENVINFNAAGLIYIADRFGYTAKICAREYNKDWLDVAPTEPEGQNRNGLYFAEESQTNRKPFLTIVYKV